MTINNPQNCTFNEGFITIYNGITSASGRIEESVVVPFEEQTTQVNEPQDYVAEPDSTRLAVKNAIIKVMNATDEDGDYIFAQQRHWLGIYRVLADKKIIPEENWSIFEEYINTLFPSFDEQVRVKLNAKDLSRAVVTPFNRPFSKWKVEDYDGKSYVFNTHHTIAKTFMEELIL